MNTTGVWQQLKNCDESQPYILNFVRPKKVWMIDGMEDEAEEMGIEVNGNEAEELKVEVEDEAESGSRKVKKMQDPIRPSAGEVCEHNLTHLPYRSWCEHCVKGRGK